MLFPSGLLVSLIELPAQLSWWPLAGGERSEGKVEEMGGGKRKGSLRGRKQVSPLMIAQVWLMHTQWRTKTHEEFRG